MASSWKLGKPYVHSIEQYFVSGGMFASERPQDLHVLSIMLPRFENL